MKFKKPISLAAVLGAAVGTLMIGYLHTKQAVPPNITPEPDVLGSQVFVTGSQEIGLDSRESTVPGERSNTTPNLVDEIILRKPQKLTSKGLPSSLAAEFDLLSTDAGNGNAEAAFLLYRGLSTCGSGHIYKTDDELEAAIREMQRTGSIIIRGRYGEYRKMVDPAKWEPLIRQRQEFCFGIDATKLATTDKWLVLSADLGNSQSQMQLGSENYGSKFGQDYLHMAWLQGSFDALGWLANAFSESGDNVTAYAYQLAYVQLSEKDFKVRGLANTEMANRWMEAGKQGLLQMERGLSRQDRERAFEIARILLKSNQACCLQRGN